MQVRTKQAVPSSVLRNAGVAGLGAYVYLDRSGKPEVKAKKPQEKSPLDPDNFVDFKLKKVVPYNHNTATYVHFVAR